MLFASLTLAVAAVAPAVAAQAVKNPFSLTVVPADGSAEFPLGFIAGYPGQQTVLATDTQAQTAFGLDQLEFRLFDTKKGSVNETSALDAGARIYLTPENGDWGFETVTKNGAVYLVKAGTSKENVISWRAGSAVGYPLYWLGASDNDANAAVRIDEA